MCRSGQVGGDQKKKGVRRGRKGGRILGFWSRSRGLKKGVSSSWSFLVGLSISAKGTALEDCKGRAFAVREKPRAGRSPNKGDGELTRAGTGRDILS